LSVIKIWFSNRISRLPVKDGRWSEALILVKPETVVAWHRAGFRLFWRFRSRFRRPGRPKISGEIRHLIRRMKADNPSWGAPRIHGELLQLGFEISEPTVSRYLRQMKRRGDAGKAKHWLTFLQNHREVTSVAFSVAKQQEVIEIQLTKRNLAAHPSLS
jgi:hypothetical protein